MMLQALAGLALYCAQVLAIMGSFNVALAPQLQNLASAFRVFIFDVSALRIACFAGASGSARYAGVLLTPLAIPALFALLYKFPGVEKAKLANALGMLTSAAYIALAKSTMQYFERTEHPLAPLTLTAFPDVDYDSDEHRGMLPFAVIGILFYVIGICLLLAGIA